MTVHYFFSYYSSYRPESWYIRVVSLLLQSSSSSSLLLLALFFKNNFFLTFYPFDLFLSFVLVPPPSPAPPAHTSSRLNRTTAAATSHGYIYRGNPATLYNIPTIPQPTSDHLARGRTKRKYIINGNKK